MRAILSTNFVRATAIAVAAAVTATAPCHGQFPDTLWVPVIYYDYHADGSNPNFEPSLFNESYAGLRTGMVREILSADRKPLLRMNRVFNDRVEEWFRPSGIAGTQAAFSIEPFDGRGRWSDLVPYQGRANEWVGRNYNPRDPMACVVIYDSLPFQLSDIRTGMFRYNNTYFLPLDGRGFGAEPASYPRYFWVNSQGNNFSFAMELHRDFIYRPGLEFDFTGDDDVWAFVNGRLVMDLGGIHGPLNQTVRLDTLRLTPGRIYQFDFFFSERHVTHSQLTLSANFLLAPYTVITLVPHESPTWDATPLLRWHPGEFSVTYTLQVSSSPSFATVLHSSTTRDTFAVVPVLVAGVYYWRVRADNTLWSSPGSFVLLDPGVPILVPVTPDPTVERLPVLRWRAPPQLAATYHLLVSAAPDFSASLWDTTVADTAAQIGTPLPYGPVYWTVRSSARWIWALPDTFTVVPDTVPRLVAYHGDTVDSFRPVLAWHPVPGAGAYRLEYANNPLFFRALTALIHDTTFTPDSLREGIVWYWRVSMDQDDAQWSAVDSFVTPLRQTAVTDVRRPPTVTDRPLLMAYDLRGRRVECLPCTYFSQLVPTTRVSRGMAHLCIGRRISGRATGLGERGLSHQ